MDNIELILTESQTIKAIIPGYKIQIYHFISSCVGDIMRGQE